MIEIVNVDKNRRMFGPHTYELRLNGKAVGTFVHNREDGLAECLKKASLIPNNDELTGLNALMHFNHDFDADSVLNE